MLGQQFATILARTDPFDVAQGLERHVRVMNGAEIRMLVQAAAPRMNDGYRAEFLPLLNEMDEQRLRAAFAHSLKSNLRAIPLFGPNFCEGVIAKIPGDRTVGLGEEHHGLRMRPVAFAIIALALVIGGAAAQRVLSTARANAGTPVVLVTPEPLQALSSAAPAAVAQTAARTRETHTAAPARASASPAQPTSPPTRAAAPPPFAQSEPAAPLARAPQVTRTPPPGSGVKTVVAQEPRPTPTPEPSPVDVTDMPQAYSDATPLPSDATPAPPSVDTAGVRVPTPTPEPNRSWTHRLVHAAVHMVNSTLTTVGVSKKPSQPKPSASPSGPRP